MRAENLNKAVELNKNIERLATAITELEMSKDIQVRVFSHTRAEFVINAHVDQEALRTVLLSESRKKLETMKKDLKEMGVEQ